MAAPSDDRVDLTELDVITRYSLAVRTATAARGELIAALRSDLAWLEGGRSGPGRARKAVATPARKTATTPARKTAASKAAGRRRAR